MGRCTRLRERRSLSRTRFAVADDQQSIAAMAPRDICRGRVADRICFCTQMALVVVADVDTCCATTARSRPRLFCCTCRGASAHRLAESCGSGRDARVVVGRVCATQIRLSVSRKQPFSRGWFQTRPGISHLLPRCDVVDAAFALV